MNGILLGAVSLYHRDHFAAGAGPAIHMVPIQFGTAMIPKLGLMLKYQTGLGPAIGSTDNKHLVNENPNRSDYWTCFI